MPYDVRLTSIAMDVSDLESELFALGTAYENANYRNGEETNGKRVVIAEGPLHAACALMYTAKIAMRQAAEQIDMAVECYEYEDVRVPITMCNCDYCNFIEEDELHDDMF